MGERLMPILVVEKGHCYRDSGSTGTIGEQDYATVAANAISAKIHGNSGWEVRQKLADAGSYSGNAFVAIHCDGSTNSTARGSSVGFQNNEGSTFGYDFMNAYAALGWTGGFRPPNYTEGLAEYYGVRNAINAGNRRAIIVECGFMTNPEDKALMTGPGGPERVANAIARALGIVDPVVKAKIEKGTQMYTSIGVGVFGTPAFRSFVRFDDGHCVNITSDAKAMQTVQACIDKGQIPFISCDSQAVFDQLVLEA
jgi:hypothetical protein